MNRQARSSRARRHSDGDEGFTLIELLVVITILGILAAIVVFAVKGIGDKGKANSVATDASVVRTAEEAYCAQHGSYADTEALVGAKLLASAPTYNSVILVSGSCGSDPTKSGFIVGSSGQGSGSTTGPLIYAASNTTPPFNFLSSSFIAANGPVQFSYDSSGTLEGKAATGTDPAVAFFSADKTNVDKLVAGAGCTGTDGVAPCTALGATEKQYTKGRLVVFSCKSGGQTLAPASNAPTCSKPTPDFFDTTGNSEPHPQTVQDVVNLLNLHPTWKVAIATPTANTAPYGVAAAAALNNASPTLASGKPSDTAHPQVVFAGNVTQTQTQVVTGVVQMALIPQSFVQSPGGNDTNYWSPVPVAAYSTDSTGACPCDLTAGAAATHPGTIAQWGVILNKGSAGDRSTAQAFMNYVLAPTTGQAAMAAFGYDPLP